MANTAAVWLFWQLKVAFDLQMEITKFVFIAMAIKMF